MFMAPTKRLSSSLRPCPRAAAGSLSSVTATWGTNQRQALVTLRTLGRRGGRGRCRHSTRLPVGLSQLSSATPLPADTCPPPLLLGASQRPSCEPAPTFHPHSPQLCVTFRHTPQQHTASQLFFLYCGNTYVTRDLPFHPL